MKPYRLLRNNKETGPYSAEELIAMGLKAYDLVWVDGKSAAWRYPCEIAALKPYAPEAEDMIANFWKPAAMHKNNTATPPAALPTRAEKPRFRVKADWRRIDDRGQMTDDRNTAVPVAVYMPVVQEVVTRPAPEAMVEEKTIPQVKYTESLDSIKQRYNDTILKRPPQAFPVKMGRYAWLLVLVPALGAGVWIGSSWHQEKQPVTIAATTPTSPVPAPEVAAVSLQAAMEDETPPVTPEAAPTQTVSTPAKATPVATVPGKAPARTATAAVPHAVLTTTTPNKVADKVLNKPVVKTAVVTTASTKKKTINTPSPVAAVLQQPPAAAKQPVVNTVQTAVAATDKPAPASAKAPVTASPRKQIADYVSVKEELQQYQDGKQMTLHVKNNTSTAVDLVVLDLQYYDSNGRFKKGETLYVNHLSGNDAVALNAPSVKNAQRIDYKISLLSIEKNGVYLIAE
jgi:hypothetical protein